MKKIRKYLILLSGLFFLSSAMCQDVKVYRSFEEFEPLLHQENDTTYLINFWATWCKPCVEEMPELLEIDNKFRDKKFKMILVSMDFSTHLNADVKPFIRKRDIKAEVVLLDDQKAYLWIDKVDKNWAGSIPITMIYNKDFYFFKEGMVTFDELNEIITNNIK